MTEETVKTEDELTKIPNDGLVSNENDSNLSIITTKNGDEAKELVSKDRDSVEDEPKETKVEFVENPLEQDVSSKSITSTVSIDVKKQVSVADGNYFDKNKHAEPSKTVLQDKPPTAKNYGSVISQAFLDTSSFQAVHKKVNFASHQVGSSASKIQEEEVEIQEFEHGETEDFPSVSIISEDNQVKKRRKKKKRSRRQSHKSIVSYTMGYKFDRRIHGSKISNVSASFFNLGDSPNVIETLESNSSELEEEEEQQEEEEESTSSITSTPRSFYCEKHRTLSREMKQTKILNGILQKKLALYFRQKNMRHVLKEDDIGINMSRKYNSLLDKYEKTYLFDKSEREKMSHQLEMMRKKKDTMKIRLEQLFKNLQDREREVGCGLIHTKTGNEIPEKYIDHLLSRQRSVKKNICEMRLTWLKLKTKVEEKEEAIVAIDKIDDTHTLTGYEKLKADNFMLLDKLEEKEEDLAKVRLSCQKTIQIVAHLKEKIAAFRTDISDLEEDSNRVFSSFESSRSVLANLKTERDNFRRKILKMKEKSGLLIHSNLLQDMEKCMEEVKQLQTQLKSLKAEYKLKSEQVKVLRSKMEDYRVDRSGTKSENRRESEKYKKKVSVADIFQRAPSTFETKIPSSKLDLTDFEPRVTRLTFDDLQGSSVKSDN